MRSFEYGPSYSSTSGFAYLRDHCLHAVQVKRLTYGPCCSRCKVLNRLIGFRSGQLLRNGECRSGRCQSSKPWRTRSEEWQASQNSSETNICHLAPSCRRVFRRGEEYWSRVVSKQRGTVVAMFIWYVRLMSVHLCVDRAHASREAVMCSREAVAVLLSSRLTNLIDILASLPYFEPRMGARSHLQGCVILQGDAPERLSSASVG